MAKVRVGNPTPSILPKAKGAFYSRLDPKRGVVAASWPRKGKDATNTPYKFYHRQEFGIAANWASNASALDIEGSTYMAEGSTFVIRDILIKAMYGSLWTLTGLNSENWIRMRDVSPNAQLVLDLITTIPGSMLYRSESGWVGVAPGNNGQMLSWNGDEIQWQDFPPNVSTGYNPWRIIGNITITSPASTVSFAGLGGFAEFLVCLKGITTSVSSLRGLAVSDDNGATYKRTSGDYFTLNTDGSETSHSGFGIWAAPVSTAQSADIKINGTNTTGNRKPITNQTIAGVTVTNTTNPINGLQIYTVSGNLTGGSIIILGR